MAITKKGMKTSIHNSRKVKGMVFCKKKARGDIYGA